MLKSFLHYQITEKLGEGGMGMVFQARDTKLRRTVALKFLSHRIAENTIEHNRFQQEAQSAAALNHPNIAQIYAFEEMDGELCIVMEYVQGQELKECIEQGNLTVDQKCAIAKQIAQALKAAHDKGIIHRDIKSRNIMINEEGNVKVMDFGLARMQGEAHITKTGTTLGTTSYMAPEQLIGEEMDARSDIWAFGVVLYELFTGELPFQGAYEPAVLYAITEEDPLPVLELNPEIPQIIADVIDQCLVKNKDLRYQSIDAILADLTIGESEKPQTQRREESRNRSRKDSKLFKIGISLSVLLIIALLFYQLKPFGLGKNIPKKRYLAVLPIENIGNNPAVNAICAGLAETFSFKLSELEKYEDSYWIAPVSEMREEKIKSATQANKQFGVNLAIMSSIQTFNDSTRLILELVDADKARKLETQRVVVPAQNLALLEHKGVQAMMRMLEIESNADIDRTLSNGGTSNPTAFEYYLKGRGSLQNYSSLDSLESAIGFFQKAIAIDPKFGLAYAGLGEAYWHQYQASGDVTIANKTQSVLRKATEFNDNLAPIQSLLGLVNNGTGNQELAIQHYEKALQIDPNYTQAYRGLAKIYDEQGNDQKAVATYKYAIALKPEIWEGYNDLGKHFYRKGNFKEATKQFKKVVSLTPKSSSAHSNLGACYYLQGKNDEAAEAFQMALALGRNPFAASNLATLYFAEKRYELSIPLYKIALETYSKNYSFWGNLAVAYEFSGKKEKSKQAYLTAIKKAKEQLEINPNDPEITADLGAYYSDIGDSAAALRYIQKALSLDDGNIVVRQRAVSTYEKLGMRKSALKWINVSMLSDIESQPELTALVKDPRYRDLKRRLEKSLQRDSDHQ